MDAEAALEPVEAGGAPLETRPADPRLVLVRRAAAGVYFAAIIAIIATTGVPTSRVQLTAIILTGLLIACIGHSWRRCRQVAVDWLPFTAVLMTYDQTRGLADKLGIPLHEKDIVHAERWLFGGTEPTVWLQQHLYDAAHVHWYDAATTLVYTSHFLATPILAAILWLRNRNEWMRFISRVILLSVAGLITYIVFPEAPPWLAAKDGFTAPVERLSSRGWIWLHLGNVQDFVADAQSGGSNPVAAMPSLHFAFSVLVALFIAHRIRSKWRYLLVLYPMAMGFSLVYLGEHWVIDLAAGLVYAVATHLVMFRVERWWLSRRAARSAVPEIESLEPIRTG